MDERRDEQRTTTRTSALLFFITPVNLNLEEMNEENIIYSFRYYPDNQHDARRV